MTAVQEPDGSARCGVGDAQFFRTRLGSVGRDAVGPKRSDDAATSIDQRVLHIDARARAASDASIADLDVEAAVITRSRRRINGHRPRCLRQHPLADSRTSRSPPSTAGARERDSGEADGPEDRDHSDTADSKTDAHTHRNALRDYVVALPQGSLLNSTGEAHQPVVVR